LANQERRRFRKGRARPRRKTRLEADITGVKADIKGVKADIKGVKADIKGVKADIKGVKADIKGVKADIAHLDRNIDAVVGETSAMRFYKRAPETEETESGVRSKRTPETEGTGERFDKRTPETEEAGGRFNKRAPETERESGERFDKRAPETETELGERFDKRTPETEETKLGVRSVGVRRSFVARHNGCDSQIYLSPVTICGVLVMLRNFFGRVARLSSIRGFRVFGFSGFRVLGVRVLGYANSRNLTGWSLWASVARFFSLERAQRIRHNTYVVLAFVR